MVQQNKIIATGEYAILDTRADIGAVALELGSDIAFTVHAPYLGKAAMARHITPVQIQQLFHDMVGDKLSDASRASIEIRIVGGSASGKVIEYLEGLMKTLLAVDGGTDAINIVSSDIPSSCNSVFFDPQLNLLTSYTA